MKRTYRIVCIGASAGGLNAISKILSLLPGTFPLPIVIAQHLHPEQNVLFAHVVDAQTPLKVTVAEEKERIEPGHVYYAPPDYHLLLEEDGTFSLSKDERVNFSRPSIDVLFESVADGFSPDVIGVLLSGANNDGAKGMKTIKEYGGLTIVQDPETAESPTMPMSALEITEIDYILPVEGIADLLNQFEMREK